MKVKDKKREEPMRKEVVLFPKVIETLEGEAKRGKRSLKNYMEVVLEAKAVEINLREEEKVGGKK